MGHLLYQLGFVGKKAMHKFEQDSRKAGKGSFAYAWVLDETEEERSVLSFIVITVSWLMTFVIAWKLFACCYNFCIILYNLCVKESVTLCLYYNLNCICYLWGFCEAVCLCIPTHSLSSPLFRLATPARKPSEIDWKWLLRYLQNQQSQALKADTDDYWRLCSVQWCLPSFHPSSVCLSVCLSLKPGQLCDPQTTPRHNPGLWWMRWLVTVKDLHDWLCV